MQRVFTKDGTLDETLTFHNDAVVLVPKGYHVVSAPPGYDLYYLRYGRAGARVENPEPPDHEWLLG